MAIQKVLEHNVVEIVKFLKRIYSEITVSKSKRCILHDNYVYVRDIQIHFHMKGTLCSPV